MANVKEVQRIIDNNNVVVFSKTWCPHCKATKQTLNDLKAQYEVVELDNRNDGDELQDALLEISGQRSVPNIFFGKKHVGGNSDLQELVKSGQLKARLQEVGALA
ncbi:glutaredoxin [Trichoderma citrinoviride]|uniref:Glutaredoxin n=1 Tax=Trichoderma citrinoviride TaxID=58853 RepID=A0A2T4B1Z5_9HYPO|nr:glutaredoxin [Trichoderma citrinoviride]PTB63334.1 glutaredoxin [Trichoderma citrinoviride]